MKNLSFQFYVFYYNILFYGSFLYDYFPNKTFFNVTSFFFCFLLYNGGDYLKTKREEEARLLTCYDIKEITRGKI